MTRAREGAAKIDLGELETLYRAHSEKVRRYVARAFGLGPPDPEDAVQAAFEKLAKWEGRDDIANPQAFLFTSARNYVLDQRRRLKVRSDHAASERHIEDETDDFDAERVLSAKERWSVLEQEILKMDGRRQQVLIMNRLHGLNCAEIARRLGLSQTMVKTLLGQAIIQCTRAIREADQ